MSNQPPQYDPIFNMPPQQLQPGTAVYEEYVHPYGPPTQVAPGMLPERKVITLDTHEFIRTRDAVRSPAARARHGRIADKEACS